MNTHRASIVCYTWSCPDDYEGPTPWECPIEDRLNREQRGSFVEDYDTGRGRVVWFTCPAGKRARALRDWVESRLPKDWTKGRTK